MGLPPLWKIIGDWVVESIWRVRYALAAWPRPQRSAIRYSTTGVLRAHKQFNTAAPRVAARISDLLQSTCFDICAAAPSARAIPTPSTESTDPPGSRRPADRDVPSVCLRRIGMSAGQTIFFYNGRATTERVTFQAKLP